MTIQSMADDEAKKQGIDVLGASTQTYVEYAPVDKEGTIWWVYKTTDRDSLTIQKGGSVAARAVEIKHSAWTVVGVDWRP